MLISLAASMNCLSFAYNILIRDIFKTLCTLFQLLFSLPKAFQKLIGKNTALGFLPFGTGQIAVSHKATPASPLLRPSQP